MPDPNRFFAVNSESVIALADREYYFYLKHQIASAKARVWASMFLVDLNFARDRRLEVRRILGDLGEAFRIGVDVRVVLGHSEQFRNIRLGNETAKRFLEKYDVPVRYYSGKAGGTHAKYALVDWHVAIVGSHNWSPDSFEGATKEDSIAVVSRDVNALLAMQFLKTWRTAK
jgi:phosphatidylserine/phosphatidylglycerophosphate/cardiolipin synthase-like enzyme